MLKKGCLAFAVVIAAGFAFTGDVKADPASTWSGVYFGVGAGAGSFDYGVGRVSQSREVWERDCNDGISDDGVCLDPDDEWWKIPDWFFDLGRSSGEDADYDYSKGIDASDDDWNIFGTVQVGIDHQISQNFVFGAFADFDLYEHDDNRFSAQWVETIPVSKEVSPNDYIIKSSINGNVELESVWSVGARMGALLTPRFLLYGMGGYTRANINGNLTLITESEDYGDSIVSVNFPDELHGYFLGVGGEYKFSNNAALKIAYRYSEFDNVGASASKTFMTHDIHDDGDSSLEHEKIYTQKVGADLDAELHSIRAVLVFRLGGNDAALEPLK